MNIMLQFTKSSVLLRNRMHEIIQSFTTVDLHCQKKTDVLTLKIQQWNWNLINAEIKTNGE